MQPESTERRRVDPEPYPTLAALRAGQALLDRKSEAGWAAIRGFVRKAAATGALLHDEGDRWAAQSLIDYWTALLGRRGDEVADATLAPFDPQLAPALPDHACPYVGLQAFDTGQSQYYFGREREVTALHELLRVHALVGIVGPSGSGKSSLARAGLSLALGSDGVSATRWRALPAVVPGPEPLASLDRVLGPVGDPTGVILLVDQFEELFTLSANEAVQTEFVDRLLGLIREPARDNRLILTIRADFEEYLTKQPQLYELYQRARVQLLPLGAAQLRRVIEAPAEAVGLKFEAGVVDALLHDLLGEPAGLPLLQTSLTRLWSRRQRNLITMAAYREIGDGRRALATWADETFAAMIPEDQETARRILLRLGLSLDDRLEITRTRVSRADLHRSGARDRIDRVLIRLVDAGLLRLTPAANEEEDRIEVVHESLVRNWPRLAAWLGEVRQDLRTMNRLRARAAEWKGYGAGAAGLLDAVQLGEAEQWLSSPAAQDLGIEPAVAEMVRASRRAVNRAGRRRRWVQVTVVGFLGLVAAGAIWTAVVQRRLAGEAAKYLSLSWAREKDLEVKRDELQAKQRELQTNQGELRAANEHITKALAAFNEVAQLAEDQRYEVVPFSGEVAFEAAKVQVPGSSFFTFTVAPFGDRTNIIGVSYVVFGQRPRSRVGIAPTFQASFQLRGCISAGLAAVGYKDRDPVITRFDLCALTQAVKPTQRTQQTPAARLEQLDLP